MNKKPEVKFTTPSSLKKLRACLSCHLIKTEDQFLKDGCDNCAFMDMSTILGLQESTTPHFVGMISLMEPTESWVAKWNQLSRAVPGCYCIDAVGELSDHIVSHLEAKSNQT